ncbi:MAG: hypothetical protein JST09_00080 [Bacteroidetes bacterium]|nr:hypothetical protein [Bacteroidota bacterium]
MKKIASILFLLILVFNFWGYRWVLSSLEQRATIKLEQKIDAGNYDESQLVEVKIPLNLPYYTDWGEYQTYYGEAQFNGENFQYVKRKVVGDTLYLLCIPHVEKNNLQMAKTDYFKSVNNIQHDGPQKGGQPAAVKLMLSEFLQNENISLGLYLNQFIPSPLSRDMGFSSQYNPLTPAQPPEC